MTVRQEKAVRKKALAQQIRDDCREGKLAAGALLPTVRELAVQHGLSKRVVNEELQKLVDEGLLRSVPRVGTFVKQSVQAEHFLRHSVVVLSPNSYPPAGQRRSGWMSYIVVGAIDEMERHGLHALVLSPGRLCSEVIERLIREQPMGVIIPETVKLDEIRPYAEQLAQRGIPVVVNTGDPSWEAYDRVASDAEAGCYELTAWLISRKRRHIRMSWPAGLNTYWLHERRAGYERAMADAGLQPLPPLELHQLTSDRKFLHDEVELIAKSLWPHFRDEVPLDAILAASDGPATVVDIAARSCGKLPGVDLDITGYDNYWQDLAACGYPVAIPSATVDRDNEAIGAEMVRFVLERAENPSSGNGQPRLRKVIPHLVVTHPLAPAGSGRVPNLT